MGYNTSAGAVSNISSGGEYDSPDIGSNSTYVVQSAAEAAAAALSASQAAASATLAIDAYESFDDRYLGSKAVDPTLDNDGNALLAGALYYNNGTVSAGMQGMRVYTGSFWTATYTTAPGYNALIATNNLGDVDSAPAARINLGVTATGSDTAYNFRVNNLSDLASASTARTNLGLGTAAVASTTDFDAAGTAVAMAIALA